MAHLRSKIEAIKLIVHVIATAATLSLIAGPVCHAAPLGYGNSAGSPAVRAGLPIVFIPGKGGNQLEARVVTPLSHDCPKQAAWYRIWLDVWTFFNGKMHCWAENMELQWDGARGRSSNAPGVETRVPGWGSTERMEYIDPSWTAWLLGNVGSYISHLVKELTAQGYVRGSSLRGAPYDFRYAPHSQSKYFEHLAELVEETLELNGGSRVLLVAHSMGGLFATYFLNGRSQEWKDRYVAGLVTINTPWGGTVVVSNMYTAGYNWEIDTIDRLVMRGQQRTYETGVMLLPKPFAFPANETIIATPDANFTTGNYLEFFEAINYTAGGEVMGFFDGADYELRQPGVPLYCFYSSGISTVRGLVYDAETEFPDHKPREQRMGDGDGTVNIESLRVCERWGEVEEAEEGAPPGGGRHPTVVKEFRDIKHNDILYDAAFIRDLVEIAQA